MQCKCEDRCLEIELNLPIIDARRQDLRQPKLLPQTTEDEHWTPRPAPVGAQASFPVGVENLNLLAEARETAHQRVDVARSYELVRPPESCDDPLPNAPTFSLALDDLEIF